MNVFLETGKFYKANNKIYLIGANVPCIANKFAVTITKTGMLGTSGGVVDIDAIYYRQHDNFVILEEKDCPKIKRKYELDLQRLFCSDYFRTKRENMPNVEKFLQTN